MQKIDPNDVVCDEMIYSMPKVEVCKGHLKSTSKVICIKKLEIENVTDGTKKFNECLSMARLKHPNIVQLFTAELLGEGKNLERIHIYMEYCNEGDLQKFISKLRSQDHFLPEANLLNYLNQLVSALAFMQRQNIAHRDIKPHNILVANNSQTLKIGDLGCTTFDQKKTCQTVAGTPQFFSPLVLRSYINIMQSGKYELVHNTFKSDVYSLGLVMIYLASLRDVNDLSKLDHLQESINRRIQELPNEYPNMKLILSQMLAVEESIRPDFIQLEKIVRDIQETEAHCCSACLNAAPLNKMFEYDNGYLCVVCINTQERFPERPLSCSICLQTLDPSFECECIPNRCTICKSTLHPNIDCYTKMQSSDLLVTRMECVCKAIIDVDRSTLYFTCPNSKHYFCVVCGNQYNPEHHTCIYLLNTAEIIL